MSGPLSGITVVDLTRALAGPYCTMLLGDLGAHVVKIEKPGTGDEARHIGPFIDGESAYFASLNRGKESVSLDLKTTSGRSDLDHLLDNADVLVENFRPRVLSGLGYDWDTLHKRWPALVYAAVSGFGHTGPYAERPAYDMVVQAMGGVMSVTGEADRPPVRVGTSIGDITAGLFTALGVASALYERESTGEGVKIDVAMLDAQVAILENAIARYQADGSPPGPIGNRHPSITPFATFSTANGQIVVAAGNDGLFQTLCGAIGRPDLIEDGRFATNPDRNQHAAALSAEIDSALSARTSVEWLAILGEAGVPCGPINNVADLFSDPQVAARNMLVEVDGMHGFRVAGNPIKIKESHDPQNRGPVPPLK